MNHLVFQHTFTSGRNATITVDLSQNMPLISCSQYHPEDIPESGEWANAIFNDIYEACSPTQKSMLALAGMAKLCVDCISTR